MSNTATLRERKRLRELRKATGSATNPAGKDKKAKAPEFIKAHILDGQVVISDYSHEDDRDIVLALMAAFGTEPEVKSESWCG